MFGIDISKEDSGPLPNLRAVWTLYAHKPNVHILHYLTLLSTMLNLGVNEEAGILHIGLDSPEELGSYCYWFYWINNRWAYIT